MEFTFLSSNSSDSEVELFLLHLFGYNKISASWSFEESFEELLKEDEVAILGGVAFIQDDETYILPGCCCGLEDMQSISFSIRAKQSPWLGHDPSPGIIYFDDYAVVWSDDPEVQQEELISIRFTYERLIESLERCKKDLLGFIEGPFYRWIKLRDRDIANRMKQKMLYWFLNDGYPSD
ncbi:hypothetical protein J19TS2_33870 [Cohnella xylanilytica]|uniref:hypothetical protein n=1 Tax=Cohnella xylanilytica TaxID=557555 RepID=UPI001B0E40E1|nr:hypothetical protein [Cohnella xylanilytica]GIO13832.1 hypothetical protein J19TS2_33870 [Cohnella xylanilytica]